MKCLTQRVVMATILAAGCTLSAGCRRDIAPPGAYGDPYPDANYPNVVMLDGLQRFVVVSGSPKVEKPDGGVMRVVVAIRNTAQQEINAQYKFQFLDSQGRPIGYEPTWRYIRLSSLAQHFVEANAVDSRAVQWRLEVRPAR
ncbi:MAG: YcfL family protein [Phycisphaeraceae bacterium]|nr:YcfL family protein [Phycisphaeraceae bacterium]MCW5753443.1 YcfL family protein [Phycisphaeraceae bacterium]